MKDRGGDLGARFTVTEAGQSLVAGLFVDNTFLIAENQRIVSDFGRT